MSSVSFSVSVVAIVGLGRSKIFLMELKRKWPPAINRLSHLMIHIYNHLDVVFVIVVIAVVFVVVEKHANISLNRPYHFLASAIGFTEKYCLNMRCRKISS